MKVALDKKIYINLDNDYEMEMVDELLRTTCAGAQPKIGLRINPVVGGGAIAAMSTATKASKFGLPVTEETKDKIIDLYEKYQWLNGIHIHIGSQGVALEKFVQGSRVSLDVL